MHQLHIIFLDWKMKVVNQYFTLCTYIYHQVIRVLLVSSKKRSLKISFLFILLIVKILDVHLTDNFFKYKESVNIE